MEGYNNVKEQKKLEDFYKPSEEVMEEIFKVYDKFLKWRSLRDQTYKQFNNDNAIGYWSDARQKFWGFLPLSYDTETPQFFFPETRNQIVNVLAKIANLRMKPTFEGVEGFDLVKATVLKDLFEYWRRGSNRKISNFWQFLYTIINGTVVVFTAYNSKVRKVKNITMHDPESGVTEFKEERLDDSDVEDIICNLEDIYIPKPWEPDIQQQGELIWRTLFKWADFKDAFKGYELQGYVIPGMQFSDQSIFSDFLSYDVRGADFVEVIKYFNADKDQYMIIANGVLLNPIKEKKDGKEQHVVSPLPWNHKKLPFSKTIYEPIDSTFFWGMPLAQKVKSPQEALNKMWELMLAREERAISVPIITNDPSVELGLEFKPGNVYQVQADVNQYRELKMDPTTGSFWNALTALQGIIGRTAQGGAGMTLPSKQPRSATENAQNAQMQKENSGLYFMFYQDLLEQKTWLTIQNMIQFYTAHKTEKVLGDRKFHKILSLTEVKLFGGGIGNRELRITDTPEKPMELRRESYLRSLLKKERVEIIEVSPKAMRQLRFDIKINFEVENSPETERALYLDYITTISKLFGQTGLLSMKKMLYRTVEKFGESISDVVDEKVVMDYESERFGIKTDLPQYRPNLPQVNDMKQAYAGMANGAAGPGQRMANEGNGGGGNGENILKKF